MYGQRKLPTTYDWIHISFSPTLQNSCLGAFLDFTSRVDIFKTFWNFDTRFFSDDNLDHLTSYKATFKPFGCLAHFCALIAQAMGVPKNDAQIVLNWLNIYGPRVIIKSKKLALAYVCNCKI